MIDNEGMLELVYKALSRDRTRLAIDIVFDWFDEKYWAGSFGECADALALVDPTKLNKTLILAFEVVANWGNLGLPEALRLAVQEANKK